MYPSFGNIQAQKFSWLFYSNEFYHSVFYCEPEPNWLPPLLAPITRDARVSTVPFIDSINGHDFSFSSQGGGDAYGRARGAWDWSMIWKRVAVKKQESIKHTRVTEPYASPAMAGGLFAIDKTYFKDLGYYDPGLEIWGGENFEISYKQCKYLMKNEFQNI